MYKDKDKQREAGRERQRHHKARQKALLSNIPQEALLSEGVTGKALPTPTVEDMAYDFCGQPRPKRDKIKAKGVTSEGVTQGVTVYVDGECGSDNNSGTVDKPMKSISGALLKSKRGKDIKCFEDLHPDVQQAINMMSQRAGKIDPIEKANRTANAIHYQHLCPDRYEPKGVQLSSTYQMTASEQANYKPAIKLGSGEYNPVSKPGDEDYDGVHTEAWRAEHGR